ncbi:MAG: alcohol dehydrogenase catalytic domain-containing protein [Dehalococcoidia bacterium]|nr:alcohol dehydrogenase catalytic domain-containing protein [Dehalococcoidia bacterium]
MKALFVQEAGPEPLLNVRDIAEPIARAGQVVVRVEAVGLCGHDVAIMTGLLRRGVDPEIVLGHEISGRVADVGQGVSGLSVGDAVVASLTAFCGECDRCVSGLDYRCRVGRGVGHGINGGFAEYVRLPGRSVTRLPEDIELVGASLVACPIGVCVRAIQSVAGIKPGEVALVTGAGGGLGVHAVQVASAMGAQVFAATSSAEKLDALERYAPGGVILGDELDFSELVLAFTEDEGANVVIDTVGSSTFGSSLRSMAQYGRMVLLGEVEGGRARVSPTDIMFRDATIQGSTGASLGDIAAAVELVSNGQVESAVHITYSLEEATEAVRMVKERQVLGRVVLRP